MNPDLIFPMISFRSASLLSVIGIAAALPFAARANEALDVLEGHKDAATVDLPPGASGPGNTVAKENIVYPEQQWPPSPLDSFWDRSLVHNDPNNPYVQKVAITGSLEMRGAWGEVNGGTNDGNLDSTRTRRARLGVRMKTFQRTDIEAVAELAGGSGYHGIERLSARTEIRPDTTVTYGKFRPDFSTEYSTEEELLPFPDRALLSNLLAPAKTLGVRVNHQRGDWDYGVGWFSNDSDPYFPGLEGPGFISLNLGHTSVEMSGSQPMKVRWHADYIYNLDPDGSDSIPRFNVAGRRSANGNQLVTSNPTFRHLLSAGVTLESQTYGFDADFLFGRGESSVWGMTLAPYYWAIPGKLKVVGRYHFADSDDPGALIATSGASADPYFDDTPFSIGDEYHSFYLGTNWHLDQNRLVLMGGVEHATLKDDAGIGADTDSWIWHAGARVSF
jgi:hypothetical protein